MDNIDNVKFPYQTKKRTIVFGGHESFLRNIKHLFTNVKFIKSKRKFLRRKEINKLLKQVDVIWIQNNCISHSDFQPIMYNARLNNIPFKYFSYAGVNNCAKEIILDDMK